MLSSPRQNSSRSFRRTALSTSLSLACAVVALGALPAHSQVVDTFTNALQDGNYNEGGNWSTGTIPNTAGGDTALINDGVAVTYNPGGDLVIKNGGELEISSGSFIQNPANNNYLQLNGNGTVLVNGGTFNQGGISSNPFNITGTGNAFDITAGTVNLNRSFSMNVGLTFAQSGGTLTVTGGETDFNSQTNTLSGGILNTTLITGVNGGADRFDIAGGTLNLTGAGSNGIYGGGTTQYINFTLQSTGQITFSSGQTTVANVQGFLNAGVIEYNSTVNAADFSVTQNGNTVVLTLIPSLQGGGAVPEPSSVVMTMAGIAGMAGWMVRRRRGAPAI